MSKLFYLSVLLLLVTWCGSAVESQQWNGVAHRAQRHAKPQLDCKCKVMPNMRVACQREAVPRTYKQKVDILKCLCNKHRFERRMDPSLRKTCKKMYGGFSIPLTLA